MSASETSKSGFSLKHSIHNIIFLQFYSFPMPLPDKPLTLPTAFSSSPINYNKQPQSTAVSGAITPPHHHHKAKRTVVPAENADIIATPNVPSAPAPGMYWSRATTYGRNPSKSLRAHTATLIGELMYIFGGCDVRNCFTTLYILDLGKELASTYPLSFTHIIKRY
jgi:hypothetical protein